MINPIPISMSVKHDLREKLIWYEDIDKNWISVFEPEKRDDCIRQIFSNFMWKKVHWKVSEEVISLLCYDMQKNKTVGEPSDADLIMNLAMQMDSLTAWEKVKCGNFTLVTGYEKLVWYFGIKQFEKIISVTPEKIISKVKLILTKKFKQTLVDDMIEKYNKTYEEKLVFNAFCYKECTHEMAAILPCPCFDGPDCCFDLPFDFILPFDFMVRKNYKFIKKKKKYQGTVTSKMYHSSNSDAFKCLDFFTDFVTIAGESEDSFISLAKEILNSPDWQWILSLSPYQMLCLILATKNIDDHNVYQDISINMKDFSLLERFANINTTGFRMRKTEFPSFWLYNCSLFMSDTVRKRISTSPSRLLDLSKVCKKYDMGSEETPSHKEQISRLENKSLIEPIELRFNKWMNCGKGIIGKVGPDTWALSDGALLSVKLFQVNHTQIFKSLSKGDLSWLKIWAYSIDEIVCEFITSHPQTMTIRNLYFSPASITFCWASSFIIYFFGLSMLEVTLLVNRLKAKNFAIFKVRLKKGNKNKNRKSWPKTVFLTFLIITMHFILIFFTIFIYHGPLSIYGLDKYNTFKTALLEIGTQQISFSDT